MNDLFAQVKNLWDQMNTTRRILVVVVPLLVLIVVFVSVQWATAPRFELLYSRLNEQDRSEIVAKLDEMKVPYRVSPGGGIEVPNAVSVRASLLTAGIPHGGVVGWEIFDQNSFSATDFSNEINKQRAIAGELTRTIQQLEGITDAKILMNIPDSSEYLFSDDKPEGTVSVQLQLRAPGALSEGQVEAIANLVSASTGVKIDNVTIIDNYANDLTAMLRLKQGPKGGVSSVVNSFATKLEYETQVEKRTEGMLAKVFGYNKAVVRVNADLDLDYQEVKSETYGDKGVPRSEQERNETTQGAGGGSSGVPGTDSNITQYKAGDGGGGNFSSEKNERTVNYEINKTEEFRVAAPGKVKRLTVGVWVDGNLPNGIKQKIINTVGASVGISEERGDKLTVETIKFTQPKNNVEAEAGQAMGLPWQSIAIGLLVVILLMGGFMVLRRKRSATEEQEAPAVAPTMAGALVNQVVGDEVPEEAEPAINFELPPEEKARRDNLAAIEKLAREKPDEIAVLLKAWLAED